MIINPYIYGVATSYDPDAQLFFNAQTTAGVTLTTTQMNAVNQWVVDSKAIGIWTKFKAVYPMIGGTATSCKFNLKNPVDSNAAFRLGYFGGVTFSSNGLIFNGLNGYANTYLSPSTNFNNTTFNHLSYYSRTDSAVAFEYAMGSGSAGGTISMIIRRDTNLGYGFADYVSGTTYRGASGSVSNSLGLFTFSQKGTTAKLFKNNTTVASNTFAASNVALPTNGIILGAINDTSSVNGYTNKQCAFASIGDGLTDLESQLFYQITEKFQVALSRNINTTQSFYYNTAYNNETNAFLFSTQITDATIQTATNTLVTDLKTAGVFTKMKALYPMVGGTATTHKFNLVNPQDTNAAFRLTFAGGGTHSSNGYSPGGVNGYANTFLTPSTAYGVATSGHMSYYSRTDSNGSTEREMGAMTGTIYIDLGLRYSGNLYMRWGETGGPTQVASPNSLGFYVGSRTTSNSQKIFKNGIQALTSGNLGSQLPSVNFYLGCQNVSNSAINYSAKQCAFSSIGDGLTDVESQVFYQITEKYQVALGRNVNPTQTFYYNTAYNNETNAFLFSTQITDTTTQIATNTLVSDLKTANIFTKMKAIYPMVGGTATTHKYNLINPQDTNAAFRLSFVGGWTHSANGALPNGTNAYADTFLTPSTILALNSTHISYYSRTSANGSYDMGAQIVGAGLTLNIRDTGASYIRVNTTGAGTESNILNADGKGFYQANRNLANIQSIIKNNTINNFSVNSVSRPTNNIFIGAINNPVIYYGNKQCAFASIGDGLTDAEALALYNAVQTFNTILARQV